MKLTVRGSVQPPRGSPGANSAFIVDLEIDLPEQIGALVELAGAVLCAAKGTAERMTAARDRWEITLEKGGKPAP